MTFASASPLVRCLAVFVVCSVSFLDWAKTFEEVKELASQKFDKPSLEIFLYEAMSKEIFMVARFKNASYEEWRSIYDGDADLRSEFMKDDIVGKVDEHTAMLKFTVTDEIRMEEVMAKRIPEIEESLGLSHDIYSLQARS